MSYSHNRGFDRFDRFEEDAFIFREEEERRERRKEEDEKECRREDRRCGREAFEFCAVGQGILFGVAIGDRVLVRVKHQSAELSLIFQGMIDHIALFTGASAGTGLLRIPLKDIVTVRIV